MPAPITGGNFRRGTWENCSIGEFRDSVSEFLRAGPVLLMKKIIIIAGPNGAGKTTFAPEFLPYEAGCPQFINADLIAAGLSPFAPEVAAVKAARIMLERMTELEGRGESFALETTLSGLMYARRMRRWHEAGYHVTLFFLSLPNAQMAMDRVAERVRQGGHDMPADVIHRRFAAGLRNFEPVYRDAVDAWAMYDNAGDEPVLTNWGEKP